MTLAAAIEFLYATFADLPRPVKVDCCPCCVHEEDRRTMETKPLRELAWRDLASYVTSARPSEGYFPDYLYFLPRIMEIAATDPDWWPDPYMACIPISQTDPALWTPVRRQALQDFFHALIDHLLSPDEENIRSVDEWLCGIASIHFNVRPLLDLIARSDEHILAYYEGNARTLIENGFLSNAFWNRPNQGHDHIIEWFSTSPAFDAIAIAYGIVLPNPENPPA